ncbi:hypothetical protein TNCT_323741 [Trichonephila clavata]|uniref:Uncharacterized protein n=1 Tax=Trichonephila clavata TaxID=2740835 RepID=A0A8X6GVL2_TRICU|nr:hypothetical protein TNCT_323741 [Trichonephila clavata]
MRNKVGSCSYVSMYAVHMYPIRMAVHMYPIRMAVHMYPMNSSEQNNGAPKNQDVIRERGEVAVKPFPRLTIVQESHLPGLN